MLYKVVNVASMYGIDYVDESGSLLSHYLDRDCKRKLWKTRNGAKNAAKRDGLKPIN